MDVERYRAEFPITRKYAYLNHASESPLSSRVARAVQEYLALGQNEPEDLWPAEVVEEWRERFKERVAALINAERLDEIVALANTGTGINTAANSLPLRPGDNVLVLEGDYPSMIYPWFNLAPHGILTKIVPSRDGGLDLDTLQTRIDAHTKVIALSSAMFATGFRNDIAAVGALCREHDIFFVVDAIQTLGVFPMDVRAWHVDFLACGSYKWLLGPMGSGFLYCRHGLLDRLQLGAYVGTSSVPEPWMEYNFTLRPDSERFAIGTANELGLAGLSAAIELILEVGTDRIRERIMHLTDTLIADLRDRGFRILSNLAPAHRSGIVMAEVPDPEGACRRLLQEGIVASVRRGALRLSPHFYNTEEEVLRVGAALEGVAV